MRTFTAVLLVAQAAYAFQAGGRYSMEGHPGLRRAACTRSGSGAAGRVCSTAMQAEGGENGEKYRNKVVELLGTLLPTAKKQEVSSPIDEIDFAVAKRTGLSAQQMAVELEAGLSSREWFVTGDVLPELFSDRFAFQDPDVKLRGIENYASESIRRD